MIDKTSNSNGKLILLGGEGLRGESRPFWQHALAGAAQAAIIPAALAGQKVGAAERQAGLAQDVLAGWGIDARIVPLTSQEDAANDELIALLHEADVLLLPGGEARALIETLGGSEAWQAVLARHAGGAAIVAAGSAAVALAGVAFTPQQPAPAALDALTFETLGGLGLLREAVPLPYYNWLQPQVARRIEALYPPGTLFAGIDDQAALIADGDGWRVEGLGSVTIWHSGERPTIVDAGHSLPPDCLPVYRPA